MHNLAIDIGNSKVKYAVFQGDQIIERGAEDSFGIQKVLALKEKYSIEHVIVSSVKQPNQEWLDAVSAHLQLYQLNANLPLPIQINYKTPETLGSDRIAGAVGGYHLYHPLPVLVIDSGTCITYDLVDDHGIYQGGQITPGLTMRLQAMHHFTRRLPLLKGDGGIPDVGNSTATSMNSGAFWGLIHEMNGFIEYYKKRHPNIKVVMTGGNASIFVPKMKYEIFALPDLIIMGLIQILRYNVEG